MPSNANLSIFHARRNVSMSDAASAIRLNSAVRVECLSASVRTGTTQRSVPVGGGVEMRRRPDRVAAMAARSSRSDSRRSPLSGSRAGRRRPQIGVEQRPAQGQSRRAARPEAEEGRCRWSAPPARRQPVSCRCCGPRSGRPSACRRPGGRRVDRSQRRAFDVSSGGRARVIRGCRRQTHSRARPGPRWVR